MKKAYIIALIALVAAITIIVSASQDVSNYVTFKEAASSEARVKVNGTLNKEKEVEYDPINAPNVVRFEMFDGEGNANSVLLKQPKPQDFELSICRCYR
ncbi:MAG: cytochrome c maturation protein CcmE, partial [Saprospiraceae bacterium]|nr:cytochrome c maturation protein CcmE [Saprospiraceae bacterium]